MKVNYMKSAAEVEPLGFAEGARNFLKGAMDMAKAVARGAKNLVLWRNEREAYMEESLKKAMKLRCADMGIDTAVKMDTDPKKNRVAATVTLPLLEAPEFLRWMSPEAGKSMNERIGRIRERLMERYNGDEEKVRRHMEAMERPVTVGFESAQDWSDDKGGYEFRTKLDVALYPGENPATIRESAETVMTSERERLGQLRDGHEDCAALIGGICADLGTAKVRDVMAAGLRGAEGARFNKGAKLGAVFGSLLGALAASGPAMAMASTGIKSAVMGMAGTGAALFFARESLEHMGQTLKAGISYIVGSSESARRIDDLALKAVGGMPEMEAAYAPAM